MVYSFWLLQQKQQVWKFSYSIFPALRVEFPLMASFFLSSTHLNAFWKTSVALQKECLLISNLDGATGYSGLISIWMLTLLYNVLVEPSAEAEQEEKESALSLPVLILLLFLPTEEVSSLFHSIYLSIFFSFFLSFSLSHLN